MASMVTPPQVLRHSLLYETAAAYVTDQPSFLNAAIVARTELKPLELLDLLKGLEAKAGREPGSVRFGPRPLDLDILFYGDHSLNHERLQVPHPRYVQGVNPFLSASLPHVLIVQIILKKDFAAVAPHITITSGGKRGTLSWPQCPICTFVLTATPSMVTTVSLEAACASSCDWFVMPGSAGPMILDAKGGAERAGN